MHLTIRAAFRAVLCGCGALIAASVWSAESGFWRDASRQLPGGDTTHRYKDDRNSFSRSARNLSFEDELTFKLGNALFRKLWVSSPSSTVSSDGLGPLFNARSCQQCHIKDGRGKPPEVLGEGGHSALVRIGVVDEFGQMSAHPVYGTQIQPFAVPGLVGEARVIQRYVAHPQDGVDLQRPIVELSELSAVPIGRDTALSMRVAPPVIGLGLLEAIPRARLMQLADPDDTDGDGVSGRVAVLADGEIGRFGWKASHANLRLQSAAAFSGDIGISSASHPNPAGDCTAQQPSCLSAPHGDGGDHEANAMVMDHVVFYVSHLAVPPRPNALDTEILRGERVFHQVQCHVCHTPTHVTAPSPQFPALAHQRIWPYTDLLLHDMGDGLADGLAEGDATGREWRTPPLWGIGRTDDVNGHTRFLHDGRARNLDEAIRWHGGEALASLAAYRALDEDSRSALIGFLESL